MATPSAPPEITTVATVETATRSGRATRDASASSSTAPPIMMTGGMMASHRIGGTAMVSDGDARRRGEEGRDHFTPSTPLTATDG